MQTKKKVPVVALEQLQKSCCCGSASDKKMANDHKSSKQDLHIEKTGVKVENVAGKKSGGCCGGH